MVMLAGLPCLLLALGAEAAPPTTARAEQRPTAGTPARQASASVPEKSPAEAPKSEEKMEQKSTTGIVSGIGPGFIAIEFQRDEKRHSSFELALPIDAQTKFRSVDSLKSLKLGDTVMVEYQETTSKDSRGDYTRVKRTAMAIALLKRAPAPEVADSGDREGHPE